MPHTAPRRLAPAQPAPVHRPRRPLGLELALTLLLKLLLLLAIKFICFPQRLPADQAALGVTTRLATPLAPAVAAIGQAATIHSHKESE